MNRPKKNTTVAQASLEQSTEAAIKLLPLNSSKNKLSDKEPIDKDGSDDMQLVRSYYVEVALNGYFVTVVFDDDFTPDLRYVVTHMDEVVEILKGKVL